jgi:hypothetical protein
MMMEQDEQRITDPTTMRGALRERIQGNGRSLFIKRIPPKVHDEFRKWCDEELCGDYGMGLLWLWEGRADAVALSSAIASLDVRMAALEEGLKTKKSKKEVKLADGRVLTLKGE